MAVAADNLSEETVVALVAAFLEEEGTRNAYANFIQEKADCMKDIGIDGTFVISLKNVLKEYKNAKQRVLSATPPLLRKTLINCGTLDNVLRYLIQNFDMEKAFPDDWCLDTARNTTDAEKNPGYKCILHLSISSTTEDLEHLTDETIARVLESVRLRRKTKSLKYAKIIRDLPDALSTSPASLDECPICIEEMAAEDVTTLWCSHRFHKHCIRQWMEREHSCPYCRRNICLTDRF